MASPSTRARPSPASTTTPASKPPHEFAALATGGATPAQTALRWIIQQPGVTSVIPGARSVEQARANAAAAGLPPLTDATLDAVRDLYDTRIKAQVHGRW